MRTYTTQQGSTAHLKDDSVNIADTVAASIDPIIDAASTVYEDLGYEHLPDTHHLTGGVDYQPENGDAIPTDQTS